MTDKIQKATNLRSVPSTVFLELYPWCACLAYLWVLLSERPRNPVCVFLLHCPLPHPLHVVQPPFFLILIGGYIMLQYRRLWSSESPSAETAASVHPTSLEVLNLILLIFHSRHQVLAIISSFHRNSFSLGITEKMQMKEPKRSQSHSKHSWFLTWEN